MFYKLKLKRNIKKIEKVLKRKDINSKDYVAGLLILNLLKRELRDQSYEEEKS